MGLSTISLENNMEVNMVYNLYFAQEYEKSWCVIDTEIDTPGIEGSSIELIKFICPDSDINKK